MEIAIVNVLIGIIKIKVKKHVNNVVLHAQNVSVNQIFVQNVKGICLKMIKYVRQIVLINIIRIKMEIFVKIVIIHVLNVVVRMQLIALRISFYFLFFNILLFFYFIVVLLLLIF